MQYRRGKWRLAAFLLSCAVAGAQEDFRGRQKIEGKVVTEDGKPAASATVKLKNVQTKTIRSYISERTGDFHFAGLTTAAAYEVWAERGSMKSDTEYLSRFDTGRVVRVELKLKKE